MTDSCTCDICKSACKYKPGWFKPGEVELVADYLGLTVEKLFETKLGVDWYVGEADIFLLAPAMKNMWAGQEYPGDPRGECVFYKDGLCSIYPIRPFECREYIHTETRTAAQDRHEEVAKAWLEKQEQIEELLDREPESESFGIMDLGLSWY